MPDKQPFAIDLNLLPPERQRRSLRLDREDRPGPAELIFWGVVLLAVLALYPLIQFWQLSNTALDQKAMFQKQLEAAIALLKTTPSPSDALRAELNRWQEQDRAWEEDYHTLVGDRVSWSQAIAAVTRSVPRGIRVDELLQRGATQLAVSGWGASESSVFQFAANLKDSNQFSSVVIQSMVREGEPTPTLPPLSPSRTGTPLPSPTATSTPWPTSTPVPTLTATATRIPTPPTATHTPAVIAVDILAVQFSPQTLSGGQLLRVDISVRNRGNVPLSSQEPISGYTYDEDDLPAPEVSGRFRVGVDAQNRLQLKDHPYRWGWSGDLLPGEVLTVTGYIRLITPGSRYFWAGIVQEAIRWHQDNVGRTLITVLAPTPTVTSTATPEPAPTSTSTTTPLPTATSTSTITPPPTSTNTPAPASTSTPTPLPASPTPTETAIPRTPTSVPSDTPAPGLSATPTRPPQTGGAQARRQPEDHTRPPAAAITLASQGRLPGLAAPAGQGSGVNFVILLELRRGGQ